MIRPNIYIFLWNSRFFCLLFYE